MVYTVSSNSAVTKDDRSLVAEKCRTHASDHDINANTQWDEKASLRIHGVKYAHTVNKSYVQQWYASLSSPLQ